MTLMNLHSPITGLLEYKLMVVGSFLTPQTNELNILKAHMGVLLAGTTYVQLIPCTSLTKSTGILPIFPPNFFLSFECEFCPDFSMHKEHVTTLSFRRLLFQTPKL